MHRGSEGVIMVAGKGTCQCGGGGRNARMTPLPVRWGALAALVSGMLWIVGGLLHLAYPQDPPGALGHFLDYLGTAIFSGAYLGMLGGLVGLHARQAVLYGRRGTAGVLRAFAGAALAFVGQASSAIFPKDGTLGWLFGDPGFDFQPGLPPMGLAVALSGAR